MVGSPRVSPGGAVLGVVLGGALSLLAGLLVAGVPLAMAGVFRPVPVGVLAGGASLVIYRRGIGGVAPAGGSAVHVAALAVVAVFLVANSGITSEPVLAGRDPATYLLTGRLLADEGGLTFPARIGPFQDRPELAVTSPGFYERADGSIYGQFLPGLPVVLAVAFWVGGAGLAVGANLVLAGIALLAFYGYATRLVRPEWALLALVALAVDPVQVYVARGSFSEILTQALLFGGLCLAAREDLPARGLVAGLLLGGTALVRVDGFVFLIPLAVWMLVEERAGGRRRYLTAVGSGVAVAAGTAVAAGVLFSPAYVGAQRGRLVAVFAALFLVLAVGSMLSRGWLEGVAGRLRMIRPTLGTLAAAGLVLLAGYGYFVRPYVEQGVGRPYGIVELQTAEGLTVEPNRTYAEMSLRWLGWYMGPVALALGVAGWARATRRLADGRFRRHAAFLLLFSVATGLYLWRPHINPDHLWAMRRFAAVTIPGVLLLAVWMGQALWDRVRAIPLRAGLGAIMAALVLAPGLALAPLAGAADLPGMAQAVTGVCDELGGDAAVLVIDSPGVAVSGALTVPIRAFCRIPAARPDSGVPPDAAALDDLARAWAGEGRRLIVLTGDPSGFERFGPHPVLDVDFGYVELTLERRPTGMVWRRLEVHAFQP